MTLLVILICVVVFLVVLFAISKRIFNYIYESALKKGNKKKAMFFGKIYYYMLTPAERENEKIEDIKETIEKDLKTYQFSVPEFPE